MRDLYHKLRAEEFLFLLEMTYTSLERIAEFDAPVPAINALHFRPYKGHNTKPPPSTPFRPYTSRSIMIPGESMSLKSRDQWSSPLLGCRTSTPTAVILRFWNKKYKNNQMVSGVPSHRQYICSIAEPCLRHNDD